MLMIPRAVVRSFRALLRRCLFAGSPRNDWPILLIRSDGQQTVLESARGPVAVRLTVPGPAEPAALAFRASVLAEFAGRTAAPVTLQEVAPGHAVARWLDSGVPRQVVFDNLAPDSVPALPELPEPRVTMPARFLEALSEAARTTTRTSAHYALDHVQWGGADGALSATDGHQLLIQNGFPLPWSDHVLVPRLRLAGLFEGPEHGPVRVGRTSSHVVLQVGDVTFFLSINAAGRFPRVADLLPGPAASTARLHLAAEEIGRLAELLPQLPGHHLEPPSVTIVLGPVVAVRGQRRPYGPVVEVVLDQATASGTPRHVATDRHFLLRALQLGFTELEFAQLGAPILCRDASRIYGWTPLDASTIVLQGPKVLRRHVRDPSRAPRTAVSPRSSVTSSPMGPVSASEEDPPVSSRRMDELLSKAEALRQSLSEVSVRITQLTAALKQHRRRARALVTAITALRPERRGNP